jgi:hypothetical protein
MDFSVYSDLGIAYNAHNNQWESPFNIASLNWTERNLNIGINISLLRMEVNHNNNFDMKYSFLPLELFFSPLTFGDMFYVTLYGRAEWQFKNNSEAGLDPFGANTENYFRGTAGCRFSIMSHTGDVIPYYRTHLTAFFEYNTFGELRTGLSIDILGWLMLVMNGIIIL